MVTLHDALILSAMGLLNLLVACVIAGLSPRRRSTAAAAHSLATTRLDAGGVAQSPDRPLPTRAAGSRNAGIAAQSLVSRTPHGARP